jgi:hypothetical protein
MKMLLPSYTAHHVEYAVVMFVAQTAEIGRLDSLDFMEGCDLFFVVAERR